MEETKNKIAAMIQEIEQILDEVGECFDDYDVDTKSRRSELIDNVFKHYQILAYHKGIIKLNGKSKSRYTLIEDNVTNNKTYNKAIKYVVDNVVDPYFLNLYYTRLHKTEFRKPQELLLVNSFDKSEL